MIYTVTFNPSLDYIISVDQFRMGVTNRTCSEQMFPGGKGINVSVVLRNLGIETTALGFVAGFTGNEIQRSIQEAGVETDFIRVESGMSRINVKLKNVEGTEINGKGPEISPEQQTELLDRLMKLRTGDLLVLAGSIPESVPHDIYQTIMRRLSGRGIRIIVDAAGKLLNNVLAEHPFLIKPNHHELGELFGVALSKREEVIPYAVKLREQGAENVLVSLAGEGAVLAAADGKVYESPAPEGILINGVGAGDSMVAGFLAGWSASGDYRHAFRMGVAAGSASAFQEYLAGKEEVEHVYRKIRERVIIS